MTRIWATIIAGFLACAAWAQGSSETIEDTISSQIAAFKVDDFAEAFTYASPNIQMLFGNPQRFGLMVRNGYPMVWRPAEVTFLERDNVRGVERQRVLIRDQGGELHVLEYYMIERPEGWRIDGVSKLPSPDVSA